MKKIDMYRPLRGLVLGLASLLVLLSFAWSCQTTDEACRASQACKREGRCKAEGAECVASSLADCQQSRFCLDLGLCVFQQGICVADASSCRNATQCKESGFCLIRNNECVEITQAYCNSQDACRVEGLCSLNTRRFECIAGSANDCRQSENCQKQKKCLLENERCVITDAACKESEGCQKRGECTRSGETCIIATDDDCKNSEACTVGKKCFAEKGACVATRSTGGACRANCTTDEDCSGCSDGNVLCDTGVCASVKCSESNECKSIGQCSRDGQKCAAKSATDCQNVCKEEGLCSVDAPSASCLAAKDEDCKQSEACTKDKRCSVEKGACIRLCKLNTCKENRDCGDCTDGRNVCNSGTCQKPGEPGGSEPSADAGGSASESVSEE